jgi:hypothetical protein
MAPVTVASSADSDQPASLEELAAKARASDPANKAVPEDGARPWLGQLVYGRDYMTIEERRSYRDTMRRQKTYADQLAYWREHVKWMKKRAWDRGLPLEKAPEVLTASEGRRLRRPVFSKSFMTGAEIEAYRAAEVALLSRSFTIEEYEAFLAEHEAKMRQRAWERGWAMDPEEEEREARRKQKVAEKAGLAIYQAAIVDALNASRAAEAAAAAEAQAADSDSGD